MTSKLTILFIFLSYFTFAQRLDWQKVDDISAKPLAIAGDSVQLWAATHSGIYTSRDTGLTWVVSKEFAKKDTYTRVTAAYSINHILLVGLSNYTTNYTGCYDNLELKKFDKGEEAPFVAGALLCSNVGRYCPTIISGNGPDLIDATHIKFKNNYSRVEGSYCVTGETTKILSEPNKSIINIENYYSRYTSNDNSSLTRDTGSIVAISDKKWFISVRNASTLLYFKFDSTTNTTYNFQFTKQLPISGNDIKRYFLMNNRLYLFYGNNKIYFTDNFGTNWTQDSLTLNAEIKDIQVWDSTFILLTNKGLSKSTNLINFSSIYQNRLTLPDSISTFPNRIGQILFVNTHLYGLLRSLNNGLTWQHIEPKGLGYPSVLKAFWRGGDTITVKADDVFLTKTSPNSPFKPDINVVIPDNFSSQLELNNYTFRTIIIYGNTGAKGAVLRSNSTMGWDTLLTVIDSFTTFRNGAKIKKNKNRLFFYGRELYVSEDLGTTWKKVFNKPVSYLFVTQDSLLIMADSLYRSIDLGRNWTQPKGTYYLNEFAEQWANNQILIPNNAYYTNGSLVFSVNFGQTWSTQLPPPNCVTIYTASSGANLREYRTYNYAYPYFSDSRYVYAFSNIGGLWRANTEGFTSCPDPIKVSVKDSICSGESYSLGGISYSQTGNYTAKKESNFSNSCDTIFSLNLKVKDYVYYRDTQVTICVFNYYNFNGKNEYYAATGNYYRSYRSINCDTFLQLNLKVIYNSSCTTKTDEPLTVNDLTIVPNPNSGLFSIDFDLKEPQEITIDLKDITGKGIKKVLNKTYLSANKYHYLIPINDLPNGIYFLHVKSNKGVLIRKIIKTD